MRWLLIPLLILLGVFCCSAFLLAVWMYVNFPWSGPLVLIFTALGIYFGVCYCGVAVFTERTKV